ncbi:hypothetical protein LSH36_1156g00051, partial [Paralvinella palmiformis]
MRQQEGNTRIQAQCVDLSIKLKPTLIADWDRVSAAQVAALGPRLSAGVIVGIVIGVLVFLIIITVIILMVIRVKIKKQSAVPRQITQFGHAMRNRLSKHPSSDLVLNVAYKSGPKLKNFEDDIYAYGEMETDEGAYWKHSNDQVLIGKMIHIGRF